MSKVFINIVNKKSVSQLFSYGLVGVASNLMGYLAYLLFTYLGGAPKLTMSVLYIAMAFVSFLGNRKLTFSHKGSLLGSGVRFFIAHCFGYLINLSLLFVLVDKFGYPHQWVQLLAIIVVAIFLFLTFKIFVFSESDSE